MLFIFDCDGTLVDSEYLNNAALSEILIEEGYSDYTPERCIDLFTGFSLEDCLTLVRRREGGASFIDSEMIRRYTARCLDNMERDLRVDPMVRPTLERFIEKGARMCVASNGELSIVRETIKAAGLADIFPTNTIFTKSMVANPKPAPDLFQFAVRKMSATGEYCVVVEDSVTGVMAAKAANMRCIGITAYAPQKERRAMTLKATGADAIITQFSELLDFSGLTSEQPEELQTGFMA